MVIEKVYGVCATNISLDDRFTILATVVPNFVPMQPKRRQTVGDFLNQTLNIRNRNMIEQIARTLQYQAKKQAFRQRLGLGPGNLRRFGSESSLPELWGSNSVNSIRQARSIKTRAWWQANNNLSRSGSMNNLWDLRQQRGYGRRGGGQRALRGRFVGGVQNQVRTTRLQQPGGRGGRGSRAAGGAGRGRGAAWANGRGGIPRNQTPKPVPTKEELDLQLDQYMAGTKSALDKELETYMNEMDFE